MTPLVAIFGPTASGKSEVAIRVAAAIGGEVVNADAAQIYRGLDLGAAKLPLAARGGIPHHLMDIADPDLLVPVAAYQELAWQAIAEVRRRGRVPIVCGGSGMYVRAALGEWRFAGAPPDANVRRELAELGTGELHRRLTQVDPETAGRLSPGDRPRIVRALERTLGESGRQRSDQAHLPQGPVLKFGLYVPRPELYRRIDERAARIWPDLLAEARQLEARGLTGDLPAQRAIGYREALRCLSGEIPETVAIRLLQQSTRRLAKRQMTWWRREPNAIWLSPDARCADHIADYVADISRAP